MQTAFWTFPRIGQLLVDVSTFAEMRIGGCRKIDVRMSMLIMIAYIVFVMNIIF